MARKIAIGLILAIFLFSFSVPSSWVERSPLCLFYAFTGWDCPGCGLTRAFLALFHGDLLGSIQLNAMAPVLALWFFILLLENIHIQWRGLPPAWFTPAGSQWIGRCMVVLVMGQWAFKSGLRLWGMLS